MLALHRQLGGTILAEPTIVDRLQLVQLQAGTTVADAIQGYRSNRDVLYAEPDYVVEAFDLLPNDPQFPAQWNLHNTGQNGGTPGADIHAPQAWSVATGSSKVVVAVLDTGVDYTHEDLAAQIWSAPAPFSVALNNGQVVNCPAGSHGYHVFDAFDIQTVDPCDPMDDNGHGTHVAGIIGAVGNNGVGVVGVEWNATLLPCKFLDSSGSGDVINAISCLNLIRELKDSGVNIVATNNSWGGFGYSQALQDAIAAQLNDGILFVAAAGNNFSDNDESPVYPASTFLPNVLSVAATDRNDKLVAFSDFGRRTVHLGAPGVEILSTTPNNTYSVFSGTSMAAPHVTGVAGLLAAQDPTRDWRAIKNLILAGGDTLPSLSGTVSQKRLNAYGALTCSNSMLESRLLPAADTISASVNTPVTLSVLNISCGQPAGNVIVQVSPVGQTLTLTDDGTGSDLATGDGIYTGQWIPPAFGSYVLTFPDGSQVNVEVLESYGYTQVSSSYQSITGTNLNLSDDSVTAVASPFPIQFGAGSFNQIFVSSNGTISFTDAFSDYDSWSLVLNGFPNYVQRPTTLIAPFWMDLYPIKGTDQNVFSAVTGNAPNRQLVIEWRNVRSFLCRSDSSAAVTFEVVFQEGSRNIQFNYADTLFGGNCASQDYGQPAEIGVQPSPTSGVDWSYNQHVTSNGMSLLWQSPPPSEENNPQPTLATIFPTSAPLLSPTITLTVNGGGFVFGSFVQLNNSKMPTLYVSSTQLIATLPAEIFVPFSIYFFFGPAQVTVFNPTPGGGVSNALSFALTGPGAPSLASISPSSAAAGGFGFEMNVQGNNLTNTTIYWNGQPLQTFDFDNNNVAAEVPSNLLASPGTAQILAVVTGASGVTSNALTFTINAPTTAQILSRTGASQTINSTSRTPATLSAAQLPQRFLGWKYGQKFGTAYVQRFSRPYTGTTIPRTSQLITGSTSLASATNSSTNFSQPPALPGFAWHPDLPAGYLPTSVATGDFNRDGKLDWVVSNGGSSDLWIYFGNGDGSAQLPRIIHLTGAAPLQVVTADLRNIGILDLVVAEADTQTVGVLLGNGDGTFQPEVTYYVQAPPLSISVADFNRDGFSDIVVGLGGDPTTGPLATLLGIGGGKFGPPLIAPSGAGSFFATTSIVAADLNGDGYPDLLLIDESGSDPFGAHSYLNEGDGTFKDADFFFPAFATPNLPVFPTSVAVGDINGDGCLDAVTPDSLGLVRMFTGNCDGSFQQSSVPYAGAGDIGVSIGLADMDGDGLLDVVTAGAYLGVGGPPFGAEASNLVTILKGDGRGNFGIPKVYRGQPSMYGFALGDVNGDKHVDVIVASQDSDTAGVFINDGNGAFGAPQGEYIGYITDGAGGGVNAPFSDFFVRDVDGDGKLDLALIEIPQYAGNPWNVAVMPGDGTGHFGTAVRSPIMEQTEFGYGYVLGDFRNTGRLDLVVCSYDGITEGSPKLRFLRNIGAGQFGPPQTTFLNAQTFNFCGLLAAGDLNGDGKLDLVVASGPTPTNPSNPFQTSFGCAVTVFLGNGDGTFQPGPTQLFGAPLPQGGLGPRSIYVGDFNRDGKLDVLVWVFDFVVGTLNHNVYEFLGNGDGTFSPANLVLPNFGLFGVADLNRDGLPDIVEYAEPLATDNFNTPVGISVYLGQPDGTFRFSQTYQPYRGIFGVGYAFDNGQPEQQLSPMIADFNGDGNPDIGVFQSQPGHPQTDSYLQILAGNGDGTFTPTYNVNEFHKLAVPTTAADVTGDGRADLIEVDGFPSSFHVIPAASGPAVQLAFASSPIVGTQGTLVVNLSLVSSSSTTVQLSASDPNIVIPSSVLIPAGTLSTNVPFIIGSGFDASEVFALTAQVGTQTSTTYSYQTTRSLAGFRLFSSFKRATAPPNGTTFNYEISVSSYGGYSATLQFACQGLPAGATCLFGSSTLPLLTYQAVGTSLQMQIGANTPIGTYPIVVSATDGSITQQVALTLNVADFSIRLSPTTMNIASGNSGIFMVAITPIGAWTDLVNVSCSVLPAIQVSCNTLQGLTAAGTYQVRFSAFNTPAGDYTVNVSASADGVSHTTAPATVHVQSAIASITPTSATISVGTASTFNITLRSQNGLSDQFSLNCPNLPSGVSCSFNAPSGVLPANGSLTSVLTVSITSKSELARPEGRRNYEEPPWFFAWVAFICTLFLAFISRSTKPLYGKPAYGPSLFLMTVVISLAASLIACSGGGSSNIGSPSPQPISSPLPSLPKNVFINVQATSPSITVSPGIITITIP